jgi:hypothetical protein
MNRGARPGFARRKKRPQQRRCLGCGVTFRAAIDRLCKACHARNRDLGCGLDENNLLLRERR